VGKTDLAVFTLPGHSALLESATRGPAAFALAGSQLARFQNGELYARIQTPVSARACVVLGSLAPPDEQMLSVLLLAHTLKREGASRVTALLPYLGYARQDRADPGQSLGIAWAGELLGAAGVDEVLTVDVHSPRAAACFPMPLRSLSTARLFAQTLKRDGLTELTIVAPDEGALERCEAVIRAAAVQAPLAYLRKRRDAGGVAHSALVGVVSARVAIVDDILDTGGTLLSACMELRKAGAREIIVLASHGLFSGERWRELSSLGVRRIYVTDSLAAGRLRGGELVEVLPLAGLIVEALGALADTAPIGRTGQ